MAKRVSYEGVILGSCFFDSMIVYTYITLFLLVILPTDWLQMNGTRKIIKLEIAEWYNNKV